MARQRRYHQRQDTASGHSLPPSSLSQNRNNTQSANDNSSTAQGDTNDHSIPTDDIDNEEERLKSKVWMYGKKLSSDQSQCTICKPFITTSHGGTTTLRKHLVQKHKLNHLALPSSSSTKANSLPRDKKIRLDHLANLAIFEDGRTFINLRRSGLRKFLSEAIPGKLLQCRIN